MSSCVARSVTFSWLFSSAARRFRCRDCLCLSVCFARQQFDLTADALMASRYCVADYNYKQTAKLRRTRITHLHCNYNDSSSCRNTATTYDVSFLVLCRWCAISAAGVATAAGWRQGRVLDAQTDI